MNEMFDRLMFEGYGSGDWERADQKAREDAIAQEVMFEFEPEEDE